METTDYIPISLVKEIYSAGVIHLELHDGKKWFTDKMTIDNNGLHGKFKDLNDITESNKRITKDLAAFQEGEQLKDTCKYKS